MEGSDRCQHGHGEREGDRNPTFHGLSPIWVKGLAIKLAGGTGAAAGSLFRRVVSSASSSLLSPAEKRCVDCGNSFILAAGERPLEKIRNV
jgi:hypothetical protein